VAKRATKAGTSRKPKVCRSRLSGNWVTAGKELDRDTDEGCSSKEEEARLDRGDAMVAVVVEAPWGRRTQRMVYWVGIDFQG
jgi:hypothetical protein